jgi:hypothetical protein
MSLRNQIADLTFPQALAVVALFALLGLGFLALKAWLLLLVLGWFGVAAFGFWKAVVAVVLLDLLIAAARN